MKILFILLLFISCNKSPKDVDVINIQPTIYIDRITYAKYSMIYGHFEYNGFIFEINNCSYGHHYKKFKLIEGDSIKQEIKMEIIKDYGRIEIKCKSCLDSGKYVK